jgi:hypothetical protein
VRINVRLAAEDRSVHAVAWRKALTETRDASTDVDSENGNGLLSTDDRRSPVVCCGRETSGCAGWAQRCASCSLPVFFLTPDPGLAHFDIHQGIGVNFIGILLENCQVGEFAGFKRAKLVGHADLTGGVNGHRAQRIG